MESLQRCEGCGSPVRSGRACFVCGGAATAQPGAVARLLGLAVMSAGLAACQSMYGIAVVDKPRFDTGDTSDTADSDAILDRDGDGFLSSADCNDADPEVFPGAADEPGDGLDTNCDGFDDT